MGTNGGEDEVTEGSEHQDPTGAQRAGGASYSFPSFSHCFRVALWVSSEKMFKYLLRCLIGCSMRTLIHSNFETFIIKKSLQINSQKRDN